MRTPTARIKNLDPSVIMGAIMVNGTLTVCSGIASTAPGSIIMTAAVSRVWPLHVDDHRITPLEKQDHLLTLRARRVEIAMDRTCRDVEEVSRTDGEGVPSTGTILEASGSQDDASVDIVVAMVMPTGDYAWVNARANYHKPFSLESKVPSDTWASWGFREGILL